MGGELPAGPPVFSPRAGDADHHWLRGQNAADVAGTDAGSRVCSARHLLLCAACSECGRGWGAGGVPTLYFPSQGRNLGERGKIHPCGGDPLCPILLPSPGYPGLWFRPQGAGAAPAEALREEEDPSSKPDPGAPSAPISSCSATVRSSVTRGWILTWGLGGGARGTQADPRAASPCRQPGGCTPQMPAGGT